jgi:apolipoprotein N-acyltransferase
MLASSFLKKKTFLTLILSLFFGGLSVFSFAPFNFYFVIFVSLTALLLLIRINDGPNYHALIFGLGFFLSGVYWLVICLNQYGQMNFYLAALFTFILCIFLSLFFYPITFYKKYYTSLFFIPIIFTLIEWLRGVIFTGFPWLSLGYSQVPNSPLAGYIPIVGIHGVTFLILLSITITLKIFQGIYSQKSIGLGLFLIFIWGSGELLKNLSWVSKINSPLKVSLIQGNISQDKKWDSKFLKEGLAKYMELIKSSNASLIILPETSIPLMLHQIPNNYLNEIRSHAMKNGGDVILGVIEKKSEEFYNSAISIGNAPMQYYRKFHLVPFGEFIPFNTIIGYVYKHWLNIPFSNLSRGSKIQPLIAVSGQRLGLNICYEDVFGYEIIKSLPEATLLVNISNDAWYGKSIAASQHLQISQARAMETQRMMLRATNTGVTAIIDINGNLISSLPQHEAGKLDGIVQGYIGSTPYSRYGNYPLVILCLLSLLFIVRSKR